MKKLYLSASFGLAIMAAVWLFFYPALFHGFINCDDPVYITQNPLIVHWYWPHIQQLLGVKDYWMPLTWLSHVLDYQLFGLNPMGHHAVAIAIHSINACLAVWGIGLFLNLVFPTISKKHRLVFQVLFGLVWALHPLRIEAVVWASQRKELLSGLFCLLSLGSYVSHLSSTNKRSKPIFLVVSILAFVAALASKPSAIMLPFVFFLTEYFLAKRPILISALKQFPLLGLSAMVAVLAFWGQSHINAVISPQSFSLQQRIVHALFSLGFYIEKTFFPYPLSLYYPFQHLKSSALASSFLLLGLFFCWSLYAYRTQKQALGLWALLSYLVLILPVLGLSLVGNQIRADRWTYMATFGFYVLAAAIAYNVFSSETLSTLKKRFIGVCFAMWCLFLSTVHATYLPVWTSSQTLWEHVVHTFPGSISTAHNNLGLIYLEQQQFKKALPELIMAAALNPKSEATWTNLGNLGLMQRRLYDAKRAYLKAVSLNPKYAPALTNLGLVYHQMGETDKAIDTLTTLTQTHPDYAIGFHNLGTVQLDLYRYTEAIPNFKQALFLNPTYAEAYYNLGRCYEALKQPSEALACYKQASALAPGRFPVH